MSLRRLEGWIPERRTEYEHDDSGRLISSTEYVESEWDDEQIAIMVALEEWEATRCPACGGDPGECQAQGATNKFKVTGPKRCGRTAAKRAKEREWLAGKDEIPESLLFRVEPV